MYLEIAERVPSLRKCASSLQSLNAYSKKRIEEYDFEARLDAYRTFAADVKTYNPEVTEILPVMYQCFFDMADADLSIRTMAASTVAAIVRKVHTQPPAPSEYGVVADKKLNVLSTYIVPMLKLGLKKVDDVIRDEYVKLLRTIILVIPERYPDLLLLTDSDPELDILHNIVHIQMHRRIRAILKLKTILQTGKISPGTITVWLIPLITHYVYTANVVVAEGGTRGGKDVITGGGNAFPLHIVCLVILCC